MSQGLAGDGPYLYHMDGPKGALYDHFPCHKGWLEMVPTCTTRMGRRVLLMTIFCAIQIGRRWSTLVPHGWAKGCSLLPFPMPHRLAGDGPYWYHTDGLNGTPCDHFLCHKGRPEIVPICTTWVGQKVLLMIISCAT